MNRVNIISNQDGTLLSIMYFEVANPKGIVQIVHGMCEHKERYKELLHVLGENGYIGIIHDHRGHGQSVKKNKDLGYFGENGARDMVDDVYQVNQWIHQKYPSLPIYLLGHSMGSLVARVYLQKYERSISGLIVCGSPSYNPLASLGIPLTTFLERKKGAYYRSPFVHRIAFGLYNRKIKDAKSEHQWICSDDEVVKQYDKDPLCNFMFTVNGYHALFILMKWTYSKKYYHPRKPHLPILFISGKEDPCLVSEKKFDGAVDFMADQGYDQVESILYPKMRHEILNETHRQIVYKDLIQFLNSINQSNY